MLISVLAITVLSSAPVPLQAPGSPEWVLNKFYVDSIFPEQSEYIIGEFADHYSDEPTMGAFLRGRATVTHRPIHRDSSSAIYATAIRTEKGPEDWYTYLVLHQRRWKISAVRTLATTGPIHMAIEQLSAQRNLPDSLTNLLAAMRLVVSSDSAIAEHIRKNLPIFSDLVNLFRTWPTIQSVNSRGHTRATGPTLSPSDLDRMTGLMGELRLSAVYRSEDAPGCVFLQIGGLVDNEVGYLYAPTGCSVPRMTPQRYVYVERVAGNWYVYKTT